MAATGRRGGRAQSLNGRAMSLPPNPEWHPATVKAGNPVPAGNAHGPAPVLPLPHDTHGGNPFAELCADALFLVWGPPQLGPRSQVFARELGISELHFVHTSLRRGAFTAPLRYAYQTVATVRLLFRKRPRIVFVQSPPSWAVLIVYLYCALTGSRYLIDAHSAAFQHAYWTRPAWLHTALARRAVATIVTNETFARLIAQRGAAAFILRDIPTHFPRAACYPLHGRFNIAVVNTFSPDEPLAEILEAAAGLEDVQFYVTGKKSSADREFFAGVPANVHFTDFLPDASYYALLSSCQAVLCLTTRDDTMQRGACEALSLGRPIITSDWPLLKSYFAHGAVHVANSSSDILRGVWEMRANYRRYQAGIGRLQSMQREEWESKVEALSRILRASMHSAS